MPRVNPEKEGTPLTVLCTESYPSWLADQTERIKNWLTQTCFDGRGVCLIPSVDGKLESVLAVFDSPERYFASAELVTRLPVKQYLLQTEEKYREAVAFSWAVGSYRFNRYTQNTQPLPTLAVGNRIVSEKVSMLAEATALVRDLVNTPAADMTPEHLGQTAASLAARFGANINQIVGEQLLEQNYPTIHAVGRASCHPPRLIDLTWGEGAAPRLTLVGKGVCFDSGGLGLKSRSGMRLMKKDMGGAAQVLGLAYLIMSTKLPVRLRVLIPAVENAVSGNSQRPGDIVTTRTGMTVEVGNTDSEGRLILGDALAEADSEKPDLLIDFSTLTSAMRIALGTELPGFFSTCNKVASDISTAGDRVFDPVWRMPLYSPYRDLLKSAVADLSNCAEEPQGGAIIAALYLQEFVSRETDWVHFDIMGWNNRYQPGRPIGGEAFGMRAVFEYLQSRYGK